MVYQIRLSKRVIKYLKKLKNKNLQKLFVDTIYNDIANNPYDGTARHGDLSGFYTFGFNYDRTSYRIAYTIDDEGEIIIFVLTVSHEKFYQQLKIISK